MWWFGGEKTSPFFQGTGHRHRHRTADAHAVWGTSQGRPFIFDQQTAIQSQQAGYRPPPPAPSALNASAGTTRPCHTACRRGPRPVHVHRCYRAYALCEGRARCPYRTGGTCHRRGRRREVLEACLTERGGAGLPRRGGLPGVQLARLGGRRDRCACRNRGFPSPIPSQRDIC